MAKRSRVETEQTVNQILDEALKQILTIGFDAMSYTTLSTATGISRTGISHHFPKKTEFLVRLDHRIGQLFVDSVKIRDIPVVQACCLIFAAAYILLNLMADILSILSNPRLRHPK